ncbi:MAG: hypothetical protein Q9201_005336 [Fulgogasparrea decipioides]
MHAHLHTKDNRGCEEIMAALDECHAQGFLHKLVGNCNSIKTEVNKCLRAERLEKTARNREEAKKKREKTLAMWREIDEAEKEANG